MRGLDVVLPGGGINYPTLAGAMQALADRHRIGSVTGTSAGGLVAACYASGHVSLEKAVRMSAPLSQHLNTRWTPWRMPTGLYRGKGVRKFLTKVVPGKMSDVRCDLRLVTANISRRKQVIFTSYDHPDMPLNWGAYATMAVPGLLTPLKINGEYYVDGGITSNLAVDDVPVVGPRVVFRLVGEDRMKNPKSLGQFFGALLTTIINHNEREDLDGLEQAWVIDLPKRTGSLDLTSLTQGQAMAQFDRGYQIVSELPSPTFIKASLAR